MKGWQSRPPHPCSSWGAGGGWGQSPVRYIQREDWDLHSPSSTPARERGRRIPPVRPLNICPQNSWSANPSLIVFAGPLSHGWLLSGSP